jgi:hypothetical protein
MSCLVLSRCLVRFHGRGTRPERIRIIREGTSRLRAAVSLNRRERLFPVGFPRLGRLGIAVTW